MKRILLAVLIVTLFPLSVGAEEIETITIEEARRRLEHGNLRDVNVVQDETKSQEYREKCEEYLKKSELEMVRSKNTLHTESSKAYSQLAIGFCTRALLEEKR